MKTTFTAESFFSISKRDLFAFHERPDAFSVLTPASAGVEVLSTASTLKPSDDVVRFRAGMWFLKFPFEMVHTVYEPHDLFVDEQRRGLFSSWRHEHRFMEAGWEGAPATRLVDRITYAHPLLLFIRPFVQHRLRSLFAFRHRVTGEEVHGRRPAADTQHPTVVITGATGLIGGRVARILTEQGVRVVALVRDVERARRRLGDAVTCVRWDFHRPEAGDWRRHLGEADGVIHLAGTPLFKQRWTASFKREMEESRVQSTRQLVEAITAAERRPRVMVSASALGLYGTDPTLVVDEDAAPANDLLARICRRWEGETLPLDDVGVRTVQIRIGIVLSARSGALKELLPMFRLGMGGTMGHAHHWFNWIHLEDVARIIVMALLDEDMRGPYNAVAPEPVQTAQFSKTLGRVLRRPSLMRYPAALLRIMLGEAGDYASGGPRALAGRIQLAGYRFFFEDLEEALNSALRSSD
jgi:uncharacterized protein (TIGR01777 family)